MSTAGIQSGLPHSQVPISTVLLNEEEPLLGSNPFLVTLILLGIAMGLEKNMDEKSL